MSSEPSTLCVGCRQPFVDPTTIHRLSDGSACPHCQDRALEALPALLPGGGFGRRKTDYLEADQARANGTDGPSFRLLPRDEAPENSADEG